MLASSDRAAQLPSCSSDRAFGLRLFYSLCCFIPKVGPSRSFALLSAIRDSQKLLTIIIPCFAKVIALESLTSRVVNVSEVICVLCLCEIQCLGDHHRSTLFVATFRVARLSLQTPKLWLVGVATNRDARHGRSRFFSLYFIFFSCVSFHFMFFFFFASTKK